MVTTSGRSFSTSSTASRPLLAVPTTLIPPEALRISVRRLRKNPESSTTNTDTVIQVSPRRQAEPAGVSTIRDGPGYGVLPLPGEALQQTRHVKDQRNTTIARDGGARHPLRSLQQGTQRLDDHLFLTDQLIDHEAHALGSHGHDDHMSTLGHRIMA